MGFTSIWHWVILLVVVLVLFGGRGKIPGLMGDIAKGIKSFKTNMKDETAEAPQQQIDEEKTVAPEKMVREDETAKS